MRQSRNSGSLAGEPGTFNVSTLACIGTIGLGSARFAKCFRETDLTRFVDIGSDLLEQLIEA